MHQKIFSQLNVLDPENNFLIYFQLKKICLVLEIIQILYKIKNIFKETKIAQSRFHSMFQSMKSLSSSVIC